MMKTLSILFSFILLSFTYSGFAQTKTEKLKVSGECGTCKKKIETAAKNAGATYALWNKDSKMLIVKYNANASSTSKIEQSIASAGYDTPDYKASDDAYNQLDDCCKYERTSAATPAVQKSCGDKQCNEQCMKDGKCADSKECKNGQKDCCKKS